MRFGFSQRWPGIVQHQLGAKFCIIEEGLPGRTTILDDPEVGGRNGKSLLLPSIRRYQPLHLVILVLGTNDLKTHFNKTAEQIALGIQELGEQVLASSTCFAEESPLVLLVAPPPVVPYQGNEDILKDAEKTSGQFGQEYEKVAQRIQCEFLDAGMVIQSSFHDGVHWDETAHWNLGIAVANKVQALLGSG